MGLYEVTCAAYVFRTSELVAFDLPIMVGGGYRVFLRTFGSFPK